jgi:hypothetical protein
MSGCLKRVWKKIWSVVRAQPRFAVNIFILWVLCTYQALSASMSLTFIDINNAMNKSWSWCIWRVLWRMLSWYESPFLLWTLTWGCWEGSPEKVALGQRPNGCSAMGQILQWQRGQVDSFWGKEKQRGIFYRLLKEVVWLEKW